MKTEDDLKLALADCIIERDKSTHCKDRSFYDGFIYVLKCTLTNKPLKPQV